MAKGEIGEKWVKEEEEDKLITRKPNSRIWMNAEEQEEKEEEVEESKKASNCAMKS